DDAANYPSGETWPSAWSWVFVNEALPDATIQGYTDQGTHTLLAVINRQYQHKTRTVATGALGVLSADPEYYAGQFTSHPTASNYAYRTTSAHWHFNTIQNGLLPPDDQVTYANPQRRGLMWRKQNALALGDQMRWTTSTNAGDVPYYVLMGQLCPVPNDSYTIDFKIDPQTIYSGAQTNPVSPRTANIAFCVNNDNPFKDTHDAPDRSGYILTLNSVGRLELWSWDGTELASRCWMDASGNDNGHKRFQIVISPNDLVVRFVHRNDGSLVDYMPKDADQGDWQLTSRGGYIHLGQYVRFPNDNQTPADYQAVTFHDLTITN